MTTGGGSPSTKRRARIRTQANPHSKAPIQFIYVDPRKGEMPWGYRIIILGVDRTTEIGPKALAKVYDNMRHVVSVFDGVAQSYERREYSWIPARCMDAVEEYLLASGRARTPKDWFYSQRSDGE